jgi:prepilin-type N-terminal cleavage/methylation domain-containing protein
MLRLAERLRAVREQEDGFTIIEVMVAMTIFALIAMGVAAGIVSSVYLTQDNRSREAAINLATQEIDAVRSTKDVFSVTNMTSPQTVAKQNYTVSRTTNWITSSGTDNACGAGDGQLSYKRVSVKVSWSNGTSSTPRSVVMDTMIAPSTSVSSASSSTIVVAVTTASGGPNTGVGVTITPVSGGATALSSQPAVTDANGCTYALNVTPGSYKVALAKSGNTDVLMNATPSASVSTTAGSVASQTFLYDQPASVTVQYASNARSGSNPKLPSGIAATFTHGDTVTPVATTTTTVFPYTDGWSVMAGNYNASTCKNVNPLKWTTPTSTSLTVDSASVPVGIGGVAGVTSTVQIPMGVIDVKLTGADTVLTATPTSGATGVNDPGCTTSPATTYTFTGLNSTTAATIALPYGTFKFSEGTSAAALGSNTPVFAASAGVTSVNVSVSGRTVLFDPRTKATS